MDPRFLSLLLLIALTACAPAPSTPAGATSTASPAAPSADATEAAHYPLTITDDAGRELTLSAEPDRIVSLVPSNTEIVCALDACDLLVGVTDFDDYPPEVADVQDVVVGTQVDVEAIVAAEPDLVIAAGNEQTPTTIIEQLTELGLTVMTLYPESLDEIYADVELVGLALDRLDAATEIVDGMKARVEDVQQAVAGLERPRTFYEVGVFEGAIYTAGQGSFLASLIDIAGGEPVTGDALATSIALEDLVAADPELILLGDASYDPTITAESVAARPGWGTMSAVTAGRIVAVSDDIIITRPGPRIVDGLVALAAAIHPDAVGD